MSCGVGGEPVQGWVWWRRTVEERSVGGGELGLGVEGEEGGNCGGVVWADEGGVELEALEKAAEMRRRCGDHCWVDCLRWIIVYLLYAVLDVTRILDG